MTTPQKSILVAGHICLDIIPSLDGLSGGLMSIMVPGKLFTLPPAVISTGGAVPNTGCALHKLGIKTKLVGKIGNDTFGHAVKDLLQQIHPSLTENLIIAQNDITAHAITLSVPGTDRIFLCCPGANDNFCENDFSDEMLVDTDVLHFGYPPLVKRMYEDDGRHLENMLARVKAAGVTVSMDMSKPDPDSEAGRVNWRSLLKRVMPYVDIFLPSMDEIAFMLKPGETEKLQYAINQIDICEIDTQILDEISSELLQMGPGVIAIKMGSGGLYLRTTSDLQRLSEMGRGTPAIPELWVDRQLLSPCFEVNVAGTTGAGDSTIAGFLAAFVRGMSPEQVMTHAVGVGACCVERHDAFSGIPTWENLEKRISSGWSKRKSQVITSGWEWNENYSLWEGPANSVKKRLVKK